MNNLVEQIRNMEQEIKILRNGLEQLLLADEPVSTHVVEILNRHDEFKRVCK